MSSTSTAAALNVTYLPIDQIRAGENDRTIFDESALQELTASIIKDGLRQPISVRPMPDGTYQIVAGERRYRATQQAISQGQHPATIAAIVTPMSDEQAASVMLAENLQRKDLDPVDEAQAYQKRMQQFGWTVEQCAEKCHVSKRRIEDRLALLNLSDYSQHLVRVGQFGLGYARELARLDKNYQMLAMKAWQARPGMYLEQFKQIVNEFQKEQCQQVMFADSVFAAMPGAAIVQQVLLEPPQTEVKRFTVSVKGITMAMVVEHTSEHNIPDVFSPAQQEAIYRILTGQTT